MKFKKGDLVVHAKGAISPHRYLVGSVVKVDNIKKSYYVFWYTTQYKSMEIDEDALIRYEDKDENRCW